MNIFIAAKNGDVEFVQNYIASGRNLSRTDKYDNTALYYASANNKLELMKILVAADADIDQHFGPDDTTILIDSIRRGRQNVVNLALVFGADVNKRDTHSRAPIQFAVQKNQRDVVIALLERGAIVDTDDCDNRSPLSIAVAYNLVDMVALLLENDADPETCDRHGTKLLIRAMTDEKIEIVELFLQYSSDHRKDSALKAALTQKDRNPAIITLLVRHGANIHRRVKKICYWEHDDTRFDTLARSSMFDYACESHHVDIDGISPVRTVADDTIRHIMIHRLLLENTIAMHNLQLPVYVMLWIFDFLPHVSSVTQFQKVQHLERLFKSLQKIQRSDRCLKRKNE